MGSINNLPKGAKLIQEFDGIINKPDAWTHGKRVNMQWFEDYCSKGYKSNYSAVLTHFLVLRISGEKTRCIMYSGNRIHKAAEIFNGWKNDLKPFLNQIAP